MNGSRARIWSTLRRKALNAVLMLLPSVSVLPCEAAPELVTLLIVSFVPAEGVAAHLSNPAKSTKRSLEVVTAPVSCSVRLTSRTMIMCVRLELAFAAVRALDLASTAR